MTGRRSSLTIAFLILCSMALPVRGSAGTPVVLLPRKGNVSIYAGSSRATRYFHYSGTIKRFDTLATDFTATTIGVTGAYGLADKLQLDLDIPVGYYSISSENRFPDRSIFSVTYYGLGATYQFLDGAFSASASGMVKIPPGFHHGIYDDPQHPTFLSDGFLQLTAGVNLGLKLETVWMKGSVGYTLRDEEPADEIPYSVEFGISKIEGTGIFIGGSGVVSTEDVTTPLRPFYAGTAGDETEQSRIDGGTGRFSTIDRETYFDLDAGAYIDITGNITVSGKFVLRLLGRNSLVLTGAYAGVGYSF